MNSSAVYLRLSTCDLKPAGAKTWTFYSSNPLNNEPRTRLSWLSTKALHVSSPGFNWKLVTQSCKFPSVKDMQHNNVLQTPNTKNISAEAAEMWWDEANVNQRDYNKLDEQQHYVTDSSAYKCIYYIGLSCNNIPNVKENTPQHAHTASTGVLNGNQQGNIATLGPFGHLKQALSSVLKAGLGSLCKNASQVVKEITNNPPKNHRIL